MDKVSFLVRLSPERHPMISLSHIQRTDLFPPADLAKAVMYVHRYVCCELASDWIYMFFELFFGHIPFYCVPRHSE